MRVPIHDLLRAGGNSSMRCLQDHEVDALTPAQEAEARIEYRFCALRWPSRANGHGGKIVVCNNMLELTLTRENPDVYKLFCEMCGLVPWKDSALVLTMGEFDE